MTQNKLRFAPIIRVSTEKQRDRGESLLTQEKQIIKYVDSFGGIIPDSCWSYSGQEHATPDQERTILDQLLKDSGKDVFDAVIVCDASRWSRDNLKSTEGLSILKQQGIKFYVGMIEYDLFNPEHTMYLGMSAVIGQFHADQQSQKSILNRIERARQGIPTGGKLPYGRRFDKKKGTWQENDKQKEENIIGAADQYLRGESLKKIAKVLDMNASNLWKILTKRSGEKWEIRFKSEKFNIDETVEMTIPRLLSQEKINAIKARTASNKTYTHGEIKYQYLFSRLIFDEDSGYALSGTPNALGQRYYRTFKGNGHRFMINSDVLEKAIIEQVSVAISCGKTFKKAVFDGKTTNQVEQELKLEIGSLKKQLKKVDVQISTMVTNLKKHPSSRKGRTGKKTDSEIKSLNEEWDNIEKKIKLRTAELDKLVTEQEIEAERVRIAKSLVTRREKLLQHCREQVELVGFRMSIGELPFEEKRHLVEMLFGGKDARGKRYGVYVKCLGGKPKKFEWTAYGHLGYLDGMVESRTGKFFMRDPENGPDFIRDDPKIEKEVAKMVKKVEGEKKVKQDLLSKHETNLVTRKIIPFKLRGEVFAKHTFSIKKAALGR